jgi:flagellar biogenesis protein FliO
MLSDTAGRQSVMSGQGWVARLATQITTWLRGQARTTPRSLRHVETLSLGPKRSLFLVECDGERFLVSAGGDALSAPVPLTKHAAAANDEERPS